MQGFDVRRFVDERTPQWVELERALVALEQRGMSALGLEGARNFGKLYRAVSSDLLVARGELVDATIVDGQVLMRDKQLTTLDWALISRQARAASPATWKRFAGL